MIGGSIHPGYPDLMHESNIIFIEVDTSERSESNFYLFLIKN